MSEERELWEHNFVKVPADIGYIAGTTTKAQKDGWQLVAVLPTIEATAGLNERGILQQAQPTPFFMLVFKRRVIALPSKASGGDGKKEGTAADPA